MKDKKVSSTKKVTKKQSSKQAVKNNTKKKDNIKKNNIIIKLLVALGVAILCFIIIYLMNHFFVKNSDIKINMSTDKKLVYLNINETEELITTQKYVSDLKYSMRYDVNNFTVFKYKEQDIFKVTGDERSLLVVEKSTVPEKCSETEINDEYSNCYIKLDDYTEEYYISDNGTTYKLTIKSPNTEAFDNDTRYRMDYMLKTFEMNK